MAAATEVLPSWGHNEDSVSCQLQTEQCQADREYCRNVVAGAVVIRTVVITSSKPPLWNMPPPLSYLSAHFQPWALCLPFSELTIVIACFRAVTVSDPLHFETVSLNVKTSCFARLKSWWLFHRLCGHLSLTPSSLSTPPHLHTHLPPGLRLHHFSLALHSISSGHNQHTCHCPVPCS